MNDDPAFVVRAVELGAQGYVSKGDDPRILLKAVRKVVAGDNFISPQLAEAVTFSGAAIKANPASQMTPRELEILRLLGRGDKIVEVAEALGISYKTVANTTSLLKQKLGAKNHSDLIRIAVEIGMNRRHGCFAARALAARAPPARKRRTGRSSRLGGTDRCQRAAGQCMDTADTHPPTPMGGGRVRFQGIP